MPFITVLLIILKKVVNSLRYNFIKYLLNPTPSKWYFYYSIFEKRLFPEVVIFIILAILKPYFVNLSIPVDWTILGIFLALLDSIYLCTSKIIIYAK